MSRKNGKLLLFCEIFHRILRADLLSIIQFIDDSSEPLGPEKDHDDESECGECGKGQGVDERENGEYRYHEDSQSGAFFHGFPPDSMNNIRGRAGRQLGELTGRISLTRYTRCDTFCRFKAQGYFSHVSPGLSHH